MNSNLAKLPFIGVDIGGSHITAAHVNSTTYKVIDDTIKRERVASMNSADEIIESWLKVLSPLIIRLGNESTKIGIAMPGPFDYQYGVSLMKDQQKYDALYQLNVKELLAEGLGISSEDLIFINDAEAFLRGELASGSAADFDRAIGLTLGTGLGSTSNCNGSVKDMSWYSRPFKDSIAEDYISTRWFLKRYQELTEQELSNVEELMDVAEPVVKTRIFEEFSDNLSAFLNDLIAQEQPQVVVLGGNIARTWDSFITQLTAKITDKSVQLRQAEMWESAALVGAASIWAFK